MNLRARVVGGSLVGAIAIHLALIACSGARGGSSSGFTDGGIFDDAQRPPGGDGGVVDAMMSVLRDAADVIADTAQTARDAEVSDAQAGGRTLEVQCDQTGGYRLTYSGSTTVSQYTSYFAIAPATVTARDVPDVRAVVCDRIEDPSPCAPFASSSTTVRCEATGYAPARDACVQAEVTFESGRVVIPCGGTSTTTSGSTTTTTSTRYRHAFIHLP